MEVLAAVAQARAEAGREHGWDARLEASLLAVHGYLWRRGRGEKWAGPAGSARFACSIAQLVFGLAPIMGWKHIPAAHDHAARARFVVCHRHSVQRWLAWLARAGLIAHTAQQDEQNFWWRTIIELHPTPPLDQDVLQAAMRRRGEWRAAEQRRRARGRRRDLTAILQRARLTRAQRRARAIARRRALRDCQARLRVRELAARSLADAASEHLTHPVGASTTCRGQPQTISSPQTWSRGLTHAHAPLQQAPAEPVTNDNSTMRTNLRWGEEQRWAVYREVLAIRQGRSKDEWAAFIQALRRRVGELAVWPRERFCPRWRLLEAWSLTVHGPAMTVAGATRLALWQEQREHHGPRLDRALRRYGRYVEVRPPGFPAGSVAAFAHFLARHTPAAEGPAHGMAYDVARFNELTKDMSAYAHITHPDNARRAAARIRRQQAAQALAEHVNARLRFRLDGDARLRTAAQLLDSPHATHQTTGRALWATAQRDHERQQRDQRVLAGRDPWPADGRYRAAVRYAQRWGLRVPQW